MFCLAYIFVLFVLTSTAYSGTTIVNRKTRQIYLPSGGENQIVLGMQPSYAAQYPFYGQHLVNSNYYRNPYPGNDVIYGNYPPYGGSPGYPLQNHYLGNYFNRYANLPTKIIDVDENGNIKRNLNNGQNYYIQQGDSQFGGNGRQYPVSFVKTNFATTKPITITINRNSGQKDDVMSYNFKNGELVKDESTTTTKIVEGTDDNV
ncbi:hypothetical protein HHI36_011552 [Cryptolaemus montrouzieri]|uniref:Uncharacterized protein n=1 Tax=Cryptolaemus montrouzieri TaxID=559131 RepID=A0ABD2MMF0_9CUCU